ncbi:MAG: signal peptidase II [Eubacteriales bacterium]|nr:signal peptidase II [Eubacteriales bacterium]
MVWIIIVILLIVADQIIKQLVMTALTGTATITVIDHFFYLIHRRNTGAAWSFLADVSWGITALTVLSGIASVILIIALLTLKKMHYKVPLTLMSAGAIGNLIDRIRYASVTDYLDFHFGSYVFPTFNLADICLVIGTILFSWFMLTSSETPDAVSRNMNYLS